MTTSNTNIRSGPYAGNGTTTSLPITFYFLLNTEVKLTRLNADGTTTILALNTDYTVTGAGVGAGGTATLTSGSTNPTGASIAITPLPSIVQGQSYPATGTFPSLAAEQGFDRLTIVANFLQEQINRCSKLAVTTGVTQAVGPTLSDPVANASLVYDATGANIIAGPTSTQIAAAQTYATNAAASASSAASSASTATTQASAASTSATAAAASATSASTSATNAGTSATNAAASATAAANSASQAAASAAGFSLKTSCRVASTASLTATYSNGALGVGATLTNSSTLAALSIDGVSLSVNDRVLIKNQSSSFQNGIYFVTTVGSGAVAWVLTRVTDYDQSAEVVEGTAALVEEGTANAGTLYIMNVSGTITMGTTGITFIQLTVTPANLTGDVTSVGAATTIAALAVTTGKIAANAVTSAKIDSTVASTTGAQVMQNKQFITGNCSFNDGSDNTKQIGFDASGNTTGKALTLASSSTVNRVATFPDKSGTVAMTSDITGGITLKTPVASTSGATIDFTSIPAGTKRIKVLFKGVSTNGTSNLLVQLGVSGTPVATGYLGASGNPGTAVFSAFTTGFGIINGSASHVFNGSMVIDLEDSTNNEWVSEHGIGLSDTGGTCGGGGSIALSGACNMVRVTTVNGTDTFDLGKVNVTYE